MKNLILGLVLLSASCGSEKDARSELSAVASPSPTSDLPGDEWPRSKWGDRYPSPGEIMMNGQYTGFQPASSGESLGEPCTVSLIFIDRCEKYGYSCFGVTVDDLGQTPLTIKTGQRKGPFQAYFGVEEGKPGKYSFYSSEHGLYEHTAIEWNEKQISKVTSTRHLDLRLEDYRTGKGNGTIVCENLTKVKRPRDTGGSSPKAHPSHLNQFCDPVGTVYAGGTPLFDERTGVVSTLESYLSKKGLNLFCEAI